MNARNGTRQENVHIFLSREYCSEFYIIASGCYSLFTLYLFKKSFVIPTDRISHSFVLCELINLFASYNIMRQRRK